jgi:hypothetical protein
MIGSSVKGRIARGSHRSTRDSQMIDRRVRIIIVRKMMELSMDWSLSRITKRVK